MSLAAFADVIGIGSAALTTVGFLQSNWPTYEPEGATVTIKAGLPKLGTLNFLEWRSVFCHGY